ncbi:TIM barrel protein [Candidatus Micrarchaeota archaeon]|nr:TIM barrel protein [Candidatus Micrarchaeota archaeon]
MVLKLYLGPAGYCASAKEGGALGSFMRLNELGLNAQELEFVQQVYLKRDAAVEVGRQAAERKIRLSIHAPYFINLCSQEKEKLAASKKRIADSLDRAEALQAEGPVVVHPGFFQKRPESECMQAVVDACFEFSAAYPRVVLGLETTGKHSAFGSLAEILETCSRVGRKNVVPVVDFAHIYARNNGRIDFGAVLDEFLSYGYTSLSAHFSSINFSEKGELNHLPISENKPPFAPLAAELKKRSSKFDSVHLICESPLLEDDCARMKAIIEEEGLKLA